MFSMNKHIDLGDSLADPDTIGIIRIQDWRMLLATLLYECVKQK